MNRFSKFKLTIIDYYIIKKFLGTFIFALILIITIAVIFDVSEKLDDFMTHHATFKQVIFSYYLNFIPYFAVLFSSLFTFISVIFFTSKMAYNTEIISILSSGTSFRRLLYPYIISAGLISSFSFFLSNFVIPHANENRFIFEEKYVRSHSFKNTQIDIHQQIEPDVYIYMSSYDNKNGDGRQFSMEKFKGIHLEYKMMADNIHWDSIKNKWSVTNYYIRTIKGNKETISTGAKKDIKINIDQKQFSRRENFMEAMSLKELNTYIKRLKMQGSDNVNLNIIEREKRIAFPFSTFILTMIGVTLSTRKVRGGIGVHIGTGLTLSFAYILFLQFSSQFAISGSLSPMLAAWIPNIIFTFISLYLYRIAPK